MNRKLSLSSPRPRPSSLAALTTGCEKLKPATTSTRACRRSRAPSIAEAVEFFKTGDRTRSRLLRRRACIWPPPT